MTQFIIIIGLLGVSESQYLFETTSEFVLKNSHIEVAVSKETGSITSLGLAGYDILTHHCSIRLQGQFQDPQIIPQFVGKQDYFPTYGTINFVYHYYDKTVNVHYTIDSIAFHWHVNIANDTNRDQELQIDFILPVTENIEKLFHCGLDQPIDVARDAKIILNYRNHLFLPLITFLSITRGYGLSTVAALETPKPQLQFSIDNKALNVSYQHLRSAPGRDADAAIYLVAHEADWRPGLNFMLKRYPEYFYPVVDNTWQSEGYYYLSFPFVDQRRIEEMSERKVKWIELHEYFPFYGLYAPKQKEWGIVIDSDDQSLSSWQKKAGGKRNDYTRMRNLIRLWKKYGIRAYVYFQSFEAWHQYAEEYFPEDIARDRNGEPLRAWKFTNLMNPTPEHDWGRHIMIQARELLERYPEIDGVFYDRMDYHSYDFAHTDGYTMIDKKQTYMLGFAQERINDKLFGFFHENKKGIWGNGPTSIEVCKALDGIMAEKSLPNLTKLQYLCLARPIIFLPYDHQPIDTEAKLKNALLCGAFPAVTYGGEECQHIDMKYAPLFELIKHRKWVLTPLPLELPENLQGNIFENPNGDYAIVIISDEKSQLLPHPFEYNIPIRVNVPNANKVKHAYLLSGDWSGVNSLDFKTNQHSIEITVPYHLACSMILLAFEERYDLVRTSPAVLVKGQDATLILHTSNTKSAALTIETPWSKETDIITRTTRFKTVVPDNTSGEMNVKVYYNNKNYLFSNWIVDPVSIVPAEEIFIHHKEGETTQFCFTNNTATELTFHLASSFVEGAGNVETPRTLRLKPHGSKKIGVLIEPEVSGIIQITATSSEGRIDQRFPVQMKSLFSNDDLFQDDFRHDMKNWIIHSGTWEVSGGTAHGHGQSHFAYVKNAAWQDYSCEVTARCLGSDDPAVDWVKIYLFFRVQDERNFYRFGIHGDAGVIDLYKCMGGKWVRLGTTPFVPRIGKWYTLRIQIKGSNLLGYIDGRKLIEVDDVSFLAGGIGLGVLEDAMRCEYRDVIVKGN